MYICIHYACYMYSYMIQYTFYKRGEKKQSIKSDSTFGKR